MHISKFGAPQASLVVTSDNCCVSKALVSERLLIWVQIHERVNPRRGAHLIGQVGAGAVVKGRARRGRTGVGHAPLQNLAQRRAGA